MKKSKIIFSVIFWIISVLIMIAIFKFSADNAEESNEISTGLLDIVITYIGNFISHNVFREIAHFIEFAALGFFMTGAIYNTFNKLKFYIPLIPCVLYGVSDEIHQIFVPDRAFELVDILIDSSGALLGIMIFILIIHLIEKIKLKRSVKI